MLKELKSKKWNMQWLRLLPHSIISVTTIAQHNGEPTVRALWRNYLMVKIRRVEKSFAHRISDTEVTT
jgi:hypothetical protein